MSKILNKFKALEKPIYFSTQNIPKSANFIRKPDFKERSSDKRWNFDERRPNLNKRPGFQEQRWDFEERRPNLNKRPHFQEQRPAWDQTRKFGPIRHSDIDQDRNRLSSESNIDRIPQQWSQKDKDNFRRIEEEDEDEESTEFTPSIHKRTPIYYRDLCRKLGSEGKIAEAVAVVEKRMVEDRVRPEKFNYITVIHILAKSGQVRKAMEFFRKVRQAGYQPGPHTITSLMNACANAPNEERQYSLEQAKWLFRREKHVFEKIKTPAIYFAAMKCFARHKDIESVFRIADEMLRDGWYPGQRIFAYLLSAALSDEESGFALALQVFYMMWFMKRKPDVMHYHTLITVCRKCGLGERGNQIVRHLSQNVLDSFRLHKYEMKQLSCFSGQNLPPVSLEKDDESLQLEAAPEIYGIIDSQSIVVKKNENAIAINSQNTLATLTEDTVETPTMVADHGIKFSLLGGFDGLIERMKQDNVEPDLKLCSMLTHLLPNNAEWDSKLIQYAEDHKVELDTEFFNAIAYRRAMRKDALMALKCIDEMRNRNLQPDVRTFGALAIICKKTMEGLTLLRDMKTLNLKPDIYIFQTLVHNALNFTHPNMGYAKSVLVNMSESNVRPNRTFLARIEARLAKIRQPFVDNKLLSMDKIQVGKVSFDEFEKFYRNWLKEVPVASSKDPKLTLLNKVVNTDDLREDWEKPWVQDEQKRAEEKLLAECEFEAVP